LIVTYSSTVSSTEDFYKNKLLIYQILTSTSQFPPSPPTSGFNHYQKPHKLYSLWGFLLFWFND